MVLTLFFSAKVSILIDTLSGPTTPRLPAHRFESESHRRHGSQKSCRRRFSLCAPRPLSLESLFRPDCPPEPFQALVSEGGLRCIRVLGRPPCVPSDGRGREPRSPSFLPTQFRAALPSRHRVSTSG